MAKIVHGGGAQMSGSVGASTYTRDGRVRRRTNPAVTVTARRTQVQGNFAQLAAQWRTLTDAQRATWIGAITRINALGALITLSPIAAFVSVNSCLMACGEAGTDSAPAFDPSTLVQLDGQAVVLDPDTANQEFGVSLVNSSGASRKVLIEATPPLSPGIANFVTKLRQVGCFVVVNGSSTVDILAAYKAVFGDGAMLGVNDGRRYGVRCRDLNAGNPVAIGVQSSLASIFV